ncbi:LysR family transcriptional regulator [Actinoplanes sp. ATCC 53533]|uniref:LysR family transcriptional regulator n=1 Tax=Actinoplanes sp. ATCC 53533 TaxID=1288362 RepID=UPI001F2C5213|nr:LysR family transcriptional regulator [Actinoplanes sp. ATCC 53533]
MIDLGRLRALHAVASYGTVLAAAEALHCTPSAVSQQLAKLERETSATLIEKDGRRLRLTEAGRVLAGHAERVLSSVDEAEAALAAHRDTVIGRLTVAAFATGGRAAAAVRAAPAGHRAPASWRRAWWRSARTRGWRCCGAGTWISRCWTTGRRWRCATRRGSPTWRSAGTWPT